MRDFSVSCLLGPEGVEVRERFPSMLLSLLSTRGENGPDGVFRAGKLDLPLLLQD